MALANFDTMWDAYPEPDGDADAAKRLIGGDVDAAWVTNTCTIRLSRCLNAAGVRVPANVAGLVTLRGGDGLRYALRVAELKRWLRKTWGPPTLSVEGVPPMEVPEVLRGRTGVICFDVKGWSDATGHFDLWNGERCRHEGYFERAHTVSLWELAAGAAPGAPGAPKPVLAGSVGAGGKNAADDVRRVQELLAARGVAVGVDGVCGEGTIEALRTFQARFLARPDGRVDPGGRTWKELNGG